MFNFRKNQPKTHRKVRDVPYFSTFYKTTEGTAPTLKKIIPSIDAVPLIATYQSNVCTVSLAWTESYIRSESRFAFVSTVLS